VINDARQLSPSLVDTIISQKKNTKCLVGGPLLVGGLGPGPCDPPPLNPALVGTVELR